MRKRLQSPPAYSQNLIIVVWQTTFITFACGVANAYTACTPTTATNALSFICIMRCYTHPQCVCIEPTLEKPVCVMLLLFHTAVNCVCARVYFFGWQQPQFESREMLTVVLIAKLRVILWQTRQTETLATVAANRMRRFLHYCWQLTVRWLKTTDDDMTVMRAAAAATNKQCGRRDNVTMRWCFRWCTSRNGRVGAWTTLYMSYFV